MSKPIMTELTMQRPNTAPSEDARDLLARLCHELGVAAVAAELKVPAAAAYEETTAHGALELPGEAIAA